MVQWETEFDYWARRSQEEVIRSIAAQSEAAASAHWRLAKLYSEHAIELLGNKPELVRNNRRALAFHAPVLVHSSTRSFIPESQHAPHAAPRPEYRHWPRLHLLETTL